MVHIYIEWDQIFKDSCYIDKIIFYVLIHIWKIVIRNLTTIIYTWVIFYETVLIIKIGALKYGNIKGVFKGGSGKGMWLGGLLVNIFLGGWDIFKRVWKILGGSWEIFGGGGWGWLRNFRGGGWDFFWRGWDIFGGVDIFSGRDEIFSGGVEIFSAVLEIFSSGVVEILLRRIEKTQGGGGLTNIQRG